MLSTNNCTQNLSAAALQQAHDCLDARPRRKWNRGGTHAWAHEIAVVSPEVAAQPWAVPVEHEWCALPARPRIFVVLTAAVHAFVNLAKRGLKGQQRNTTERREMYEQIVRRWAVASSATVVFAENSGADLTSIERQVPAWRRPSFEFLSVPKFVEKLPGR